MYIDVLELSMCSCLSTLHHDTSCSVHLQADLYRLVPQVPGLAASHCLQGWRRAAERNKAGTFISRIPPLGCHVLSVPCSTKPEPLPGRPSH